MAKHSLEKVEQFHITHHLECPRCHSHNIVVHGENRYVCLSCGWVRDVSSGWIEGPPLFLVFLAIGFIAFVVMSGAG